MAVDDCVACEWRVIAPRIERQITALNDTLQDLMKEVREGREDDRAEAQKCRDRDRDEAQKCREHDRNRLEKRIKEVDDKVVQYRMNGFQEHEKLNIGVVMNRTKLWAVIGIGGFVMSFVGGLVAVLFQHFVG